MGACLRRTPCENQATCIDRPDGNYKCLCAFGWQGRHCQESKHFILEFSQSIFPLSSKDLK